MLYLVCDGSYEGLLSAVFDAWSMRPWPDGILLSLPSQPSMLDEYQTVLTDADKAARLQKGIETKLSSESANHIYMVFASLLPDAGTLIFKYLRAGFSIGPQIDVHLTHPDVLPVHNLSRRVGREVHLFSGITRFKSTKQGVFYASIKPDFNIVPMLAPHFCDRLDIPFILHDVRHGIAALCRDDNYVIVPMADRPDLFSPDSEQELFASLWKLFYNSLEIKSRTNHNLRRQHMPKKYWEHLTELMPDNPKR